MKTIRPKLILSALFFSSALALHASEPFDAKIYEMGSGEFLFRYTNADELSGNERRLTHEYRNPEGELFARERVVLEGETLVRHTTEFFMLGENSLIERRGKDIELSFTREGKTKSKSLEYPESPGETLVFGPTQQEFIQRNLTRFKAGETVRFLIPAPEFSALIRFTMGPAGKSTYTRTGALVLAMETKSPFLRFLVGTNYFVVDEKNGRILEIHGPSVLKKRVGGKWKLVDVDIYFAY